jgi:hypothetical protein
MEEFEYWVHICKSIGIKLDLFQELKERSLNNYKAIQDNLNKTQNSVTNSETPTNADLYLFEQNLCGLTKAMSFQENFILFKSLEVFFFGLSAKVEKIQGKTRIKKLIRICRQVKKRLLLQNSILFPEILEISFQELSTFKYELKSKLHCKFTH